MNNKWALIGKGFIAPRHIEAIKDIGDELILTCDSDPEKEADYTDWVEMKKSKLWPEVTHVAICTPNDTHLGIIRGMSDKIVLCEKPLVLNSECLDTLGDNVFTVLQLRYNPEVDNLKQNLRNNHKVKMIVKVKRDADYWNSWKGDEKRSGGILFNLGIHYFDLLIYLFGNDYQIEETSRAPNMAQGKLLFGDNEVDYYLEIMSDNNGQDRYIEIDGKQISLSKKDNLSFEGLHLKVYENLKMGNGIGIKEASKSIKLIEKLCSI